MVLALLQAAEDDDLDIGAGTVVTVLLIVLLVAAIVYFVSNSRRP